MHYPTVPTQSATFLPNMDLKMAGEHVCVLSLRPLQTWKGLQWHDSIVDGSCAEIFQRPRNHAEEPLGPWLTVRGLNPGADYKDSVVETKILPNQEWDHATLVGIPSHAMTLEQVEVPGDGTSVQRSNTLSPKLTGRPAEEGS